MIALNVGHVLFFRDIVYSIYFSVSTYCESQLLVYMTNNNSIYGSLSKNGAILVRDGFLASAMSEVCFFHV